MEADDKQDGQVEDVEKMQELAKTEQKKRGDSKPPPKKPIEEIIRESGKVPDYDEYHRHLHLVRPRLEEAPPTVTHKVTKVWGDEWDEKSEKWTREMPEKFIGEPGMQPKPEPEPHPHDLTEEWESEMEKIWEHQRAHKEHLVK